eukprot:604601-Rhodomonas_salina.7
MSGTEIGSQAGAAREQGGGGEEREGGGGGAREGGRRGHAGSGERERRGACACAAPRCGSSLCPCYAMSGTEIAQLPTPLLCNVRY